MYIHQWTSNSYLSTFQQVLDQLKTHCQLNRCPLTGALNSCYYSKLDYLACKLLLGCKAFITYITMIYPSIHLLSAFRGVFGPLVLSQGNLYEWCMYPYFRQMNVHSEPTSLASVCLQFRSEFTTAALVYKFLQTGTRNYGTTHLFSLWFLQY